MKIDINNLSRELKEIIEGVKNINSLEDGSINIRDGKLYSSKPKPIKQVSSYNILKEYANSFHDPKYRTSYNTIMTELHETPSNFNGLLLDRVLEEYFSLDSKIERVSIRNKNLLLITENKDIIIYDLDKSSVMFKKNIQTDISNVLTLELEIFDILDAVLYKRGVLISTRNNGVIYLDLVDDSVELKFGENNIHYIVPINTDIVALISDVIMLYNFNGQLVEKRNSLRNNHHIVGDAVLNDNHLYILGKTAGYATKDILYMFEIDDGQLINKSGRIYPGFDTRDAFFNRLYIDDNYIYISGIKNGATIIRRYPKDNPNMFQEFNMMKYLEVYNIKDNELISVDNNTILKTDIETGEESRECIPFNPKNIIFFKKDMLIIHDSKIYKNPDNGLIKPDIFNLNISNNTTEYNSLEIFIESNNGKEAFTLIDKDNLSEIVPNNIVKKDNYTLILLNTSPKNIMLKIEVPNDTIINGVLVNEDTVFFK